MLSNPFSRRLYMRKLVLLITCVAAVTVVPAQAKPSKPDHPAKSQKCQPHKVGYKASGTLVTATIEQTAGSATPERGDDRYSGSVTVDVSKANHHAPKGEQTYTLDSARVKFYDSDHNKVADEPQAGDRVKVKGKITRLAKKCDTSGFTSTITVRKVEFKPPKPAKP
jgi:hypothetical protein